jgi:hypothetical protein
MHALPCPSLADQWGALTGRYSRDSTSAAGASMDADASAVLRHRNDVPLLLQDPITLMIHFILLLPVNIERGKHTSTCGICKLFK